MEKIENENEKEKVTKNGLSVKVNLSEINYKRLQIIKTLFADEVVVLSDKESLSYFVNKAIENYFKSPEIQNLIKNL